MADTIFNSYKADLLKGNIDHVNDTIKVALVTSSYTADQDSHDFFNDITNEITGTGYTAGGVALISKTVTQDNTDNEGAFDAADASWTSASITFRAAVVYKDTGLAATSPLICYFDFTSNQQVTAGTVTIQWNAEGIINLT